MRSLTPTRASADAGGVHVRDVREINDQRTRSVGAHGGLELKHRGHHQRAFKAKDALSGLGSGLVCNA
jgi:hypothetical protein